VLEYLSSLPVVRNIPYSMLHACCLQCVWRDKPALAIPVSFAVSVHCRDGSQLLLLQVRVGGNFQGRRILISAILLVVGRVGSTSALCCVVCRFVKVEVGPITWRKLVETINQLHALAESHCRPPEAQCT
jgi:hypothetical protein